MKQLDAHSKGTYLPEACTRERYISMERYIYIPSKGIYIQKACTLGRYTSSEGARIEGSQNWKIGTLKRRKHHLLPIIPSVLNKMDSIVAGTKRKPSRLSLQSPKLKPPQRVRKHREAPRTLYPMPSKGVSVRNETRRGLLLRKTSTC